MRIGIIGGGRVGSALAQYFAAQGVLAGITAATEQHTAELARCFGVASCSNAELVAAADVLLVTVPDRLISSVAADLATSVQREVADKVILHCSGSLGLEPLSALEAQGAHVGSLHPLQSFAGGAVNLEGVYMALDGDAAAQQAARSIVELLGGHDFAVPAAERAAYHAAACICSNYAVAVETVATQLMARWTGSEEAAWQALLPLFQGTAQNLERAQQVGAVLTGPIGRGDVNTVAKHLEVLPGKYRALYAALGLATTQIALTNGTIDVKTAQQLQKLLQVEG